MGKSERSKQGKVKSREGVRKKGTLGSYDSISYMYVLLRFKCIEIHPIAQAQRQFAYTLTSSNSKTRNN